MQKKYSRVFMTALVLLAGLSTVFVFACMVNQGEWAVAIQALVPWAMLVGYYQAYTRAFRRACRRTRIAVGPGVVEITKELSPGEFEQLTSAWVATIRGTWGE